MAIALNAVSVDSTGDNSTAGHMTWDVTVSSGVDVLVIAFVVGRASAGSYSYALDGVTYNGSSVTQLQYLEGEVSTNRFGGVYIGYIVSPTSGTQTIDADFTSTSTIVAQHAVCRAFELTGADTSTVVDVSGNSGSPASTTATLGLTTTQANSFIVGIADVSDTGTPSNATVAWASGMTEYDDVQDSYHASSTAHRTTTSTGTYTLDPTQTDGSAIWAVAAAFLEGATSVSLTPAAAQATATAAIGAVSKGSVTTSPAAAQATVTASVGAVTVAVAVTPAAAQATATAAIGAIAIATDYTPAAAQVTATAAIGAVFRSSATLAPAAAQVTATAAIGAAAVGDLVITPQKAVATSNASIGLVVRGSVSLVPSPVQIAVAATLVGAVTGTRTLFTLRARSLGVTIDSRYVDMTVHNRTTSLTLGADDRS